ncbi:MAG: nicotinamide riboside transporter PnuC [Porphyromonas sp.]|nr:nicotinamide riboside transporter PnuC [Porphyromonas sp.]
MDFPFSNASLELAAAVFGLIYVFLEIRASIWLWPIGIITPLLFIYISYTGGVYGNMAVNIYYFLACIYGWIQWFKHRKEGPVETQVKVLSGRTLSIVIAATAFIAGGLYPIFEYVTFNSSPLLDAVATSASIVGMWLLAHKYLENWYAWILSNILYTYIFLSLSYTIMGIFFFIYTIMAVIGLRNWKKMKRTQAASATA